MATSKSTPEEKLFAVIQGESHAPVRPPAKTISLPGAGAQLLGIVRSVDLPRINQALVILIGMLIFLCLISPLLLRPRINRLMGRVQTHAAPFVIAPLDGLRLVDDYANTITQQDPFRVGEKPVSVPASSDTAIPPQDPKLLIAGLKLVGISWAEEPTAMVEEHDQTYFLKRGDTLGTLTVKEILKDRVVFRVGEEEVELF